MQAPKKPRASNSYVRYTGLAFQLVATILILTFAGHYTDQGLGFKFPIFTLVLSLAGVSLSLYTLIKRIS